MSVYWTRELQLEEYSRCDSHWIAKVVFRKYSLRDRPYRWGNALTAVFTYLCLSYNVVVSAHCGIGYLSFFFFTSKTSFGNFCYETMSKTEELSLFFRAKRTEWYYNNYDNSYVRFRLLIIYFSRSRSGATRINIERPSIRDAKQPSYTNVVS